MSTLARRSARRPARCVPYGRFVAEILPLPPIAAPPPAGTCCAACGAAWEASPPRAVVLGIYRTGGGFVGLLCGACVAAGRRKLYRRVAGALRDHLGADEARVVAVAAGGRA